MQSRRRNLWVIGSGKEGVGKSLVTAFIGMVLARMGKRVIVVDAGAEGTNLQNYSGTTQAGPSFADLLENRASEEEVLRDTAEPGLRLIAGASGMLEMANPQSGQRERIVRFLAGLDAEYVVVDLGAAALPHTLDFFNMSDEGILIVTPDPVSMHHAYDFVRCALYRNIQRKFASVHSVQAALKEFVGRPEASRPRTMMDFYEHLCSIDPASADKVAALVDNYRPHVVVNMASSEQDRRVADIIQSASKKFLYVDLHFCGLIFSEPSVGGVARQIGPLEPHSALAQQVRQCVQAVLNRTPPEEPSLAADVEKLPQTAPMMGMNHNLFVRGSALHVQTEDMGNMGKCVITQVFCDGKIVLSIKSEYPTTNSDLGARTQLAELMRKQHFDTIRDIENGRISALRPA